MRVYCTQFISLIPRPYSQVSMLKDWGAWRRGYDCVEYLGCGIIDNKRYYSCTYLSIKIEYKLWYFNLIGVDSIVKVLYAVQILDFVLYF